jgi:disulfide bond formation protein DsbB
MKENLHPSLRAANVAIGLGGVSLALILGALGFQYVGGLSPCEMCHWQRWPHIAAIVVGLVGGLLARKQILGAMIATPLAWCTIVLVASAGALGVFHAGVEWHWWPGPQACTGNAFHYTGGKLDLSAPVVLCDVAAWRLFGISMAGYNATISLAAAASGSFFLTSRSEKQ